MRAAPGAGAAAAASSSSSSSSKGAPRPPPRCHFFSTFFLNKLYQDTGTYNYANVSSMLEEQGGGVCAGGMSRHIL
jgi:hypothetical protein